MIKSLTDELKHILPIYSVNHPQITYPNGRTVLVMDNFCTHKLSFFYEHFTPQVAKAYIDRMEIISTPAHGSWLNMAEIEFSVFTRQGLDRPFADKKEVEIVAKR